MAKTYNVGRLSVEMVADTVQYVQKLKEAENKTASSQKKIRGETKKTKKETEDAEKETSKFTKAMSKMGQTAALVSGPMGGVASRIGALNSILKGASGFAIGVGGTMVAAGAAATAIYGMGTELNDTRKELEVYATIAGTTAREMQLLSAATSKVGISQEKFGDQIKDMRDKLGDFVATGAGPFKDVFDVLGNSLKFTANELQHMSGPDALEAIMHAMQDANVPMSEQIFLLESLASDSSKLIPLYADYSEKMNDLSYEAEITTRELDEQLAVYGDLSKSIGIAAQNTKDIVADAFVPLAASLNDIVRDYNRFTASLDKSSEAYRNSRLEEIDDQIELIGKALDHTDTAWGRFRIFMTGLSTDVNFLQLQIKKLRAEKDLLGGLITGETENPEAVVPELTTRQMEEQLFNEMKIHERRRKEEEKYANERKRKQDAADKAATIAAEKRNREALKAEKERNKEFFKEQQRANEEMEKLREQHYKKLTEQFDLEQMALSGPVIPMGEQTLEQAQLDNQMSMLELNLNRELELLRQNYAHKTELEQQYQAAMQASKNQYYANVLEAHKASVQAEMQLYSQMGSVLGNHISALAGASDEEKEQLTKQFLMQQALAAGQASIEYFAAMAAHESAAAAMGPAGAAYLATQSAITTANWQKNLAGIAAISIAGGVAGQFHGGVDSLPQNLDNKSFLLKAGERVIAPSANKDLTEFLSDPSTKSGGIEINAPMTINGNVTDKKWFSEQLVNHRNTIAAAYQKVQKERPRRRG